MSTRNTRSTTNRRVVVVRGIGAASALRKVLRRNGVAVCAVCGDEFAPSAVDVDHVLPLFKGGEDVATNVQVLCRAVCHAAKTRVDMGYAPQYVS